LAHAFLWEYSCKTLKLAQLLGRLGVFLTWWRFVALTLTSSCGTTLPAHTWPARWMSRSSYTQANPPFPSRFPRMYRAGVESGPAAISSTNTVA
jgi:hypothetical protein